MPPLILELHQVPPPAPRPQGHTEPLSSAKQGHTGWPPWQVGRPVPADNPHESPLPLLPTLHRRKPMQKGQVTPGQAQAWSLSPSGPRRGCGWLRQPVPAAPGPPFLSSLVSSWVCWSRNSGQIPPPLTGQATIPPGGPQRSAPGPWHSYSLHPGIHVAYTPSSTSLTQAFHPS